MKQYWLFKSEPNTFSIDDLFACPNKVDHWDGIRNYQARNFMRDQMKKGDLGFFYHSSCPIPAIMGVIEVVRCAYPDHTAMDPESRYHDPKSTIENPIWEMVDLKFKKKFKHPITLKALKTMSSLSDLIILKKGNRLSITPIAQQHWDLIMDLQ